MTSSVTNDVDRASPANRAWPHARVGALRGMGEQAAARREARRSATTARRPARSLPARTTSRTGWGCSSHGHVAGPSSESSPAQAPRRCGRRRCRRRTPLPPALADYSPKFRGYALGWSVRDYRGEKVMEHGGAGFRAIVALIPEKNVGIAVTNNSEDIQVVRGSGRTARPLPRGAETDWPTAFKDLFEMRIAGGLEAQRKAAAASRRSPRRHCRSQATPASTWTRGTDRSASRETDGTPSTSRARPAWSRRWNTGTTTRSARWADPKIEPAYVTYALDADGKIERVTMKAVLADRGLQLRLPGSRDHASCGSCPPAAED